MRSFTTAAWFSAAAHISAVCPRHASCVFTLAPKVSSIFTASTLPVRAAVISAVSPSPKAALGSAPAFRRASTIATLPTVARLVQRRDAVAVGRLGVGAGAEQELRRLEIVPVGGPVEGGHPFGVGPVHIETLFQQRPHVGLVAVPDRVGDPRVAAGGGESAGGDDDGKARGEQVSGMHAICL